MKEAKSQTRVAVGIETFWKSLTEDLAYILPRIIPKSVKTTERTEGNGGLGSIYVIYFGSDKLELGYQKEKVVVCNDSLHEFALQVIEGGHLDRGFSSYGTVFQLTAIGESETFVDFKVVYEYTTEEEETNKMTEETTKSALHFIKSLEAFLLKQGS